MNKRTYGDGKSIIEILNIGFEPLLTEDEYELHMRTVELKKSYRKHLKMISNVENKLLYSDKEDSDYEWLKSMEWKYKEKSEELNETIVNNKIELKQKLANNVGIVRELRGDREYSREDQFRNINIFESDMTRALGCKDMEYSDDIISVVTYYTEIFDGIMHNGFVYKGKKFIFYTAGAGQTRNKKSTFMSEDKFEINHDKLFCGLSKKTINRDGGMNTNKYLAYTSLSQTNSSIWEDFDIDRAIVVPDIEFEIPNQKMRYIYTETPEDKMKVFELKHESDKITEQLKELNYLKSTYEKGYKRNKEEITKEKELVAKRKEINESIKEIKSKYHKTEIKYMGAKIPFTDGFGITFKKGTSFMIRLPFVKGLVSYVPKSKFKAFCKENGIKISKVTDIYGKEHSIDKVDHIFTESQFKMCKYYKNVLDDKGNVIKTGWEVYKENFKKYECSACVCNVEDRVRLNAKTNYQVLQTLTTEMTDEDIISLASYDFDNLNGIGKDVQCMLNVLGANKEKNNRMNYFQKSLILYPEMLKDYYVRSTLKSTKESMIKKFKSGKFNINGAYTFIIPEPLACLQWWFNGERDLDKLGLLKENEVYCDLFKDGEEVDCLRSPHLDHAHCIRTNRVNSDLRSWYPTKGIYVGVKDVMSKFLQFDNDGDKSLVHNNATIIKCAKSFQEKYGMIPNYYDMPKANPQEINSDNLFNGIVMAYHHGNIGTPSNEITKVFDTLNPNSTEEEVLEAIEVVALRCADVNFVIDYAKTLYKPEIPVDVIERYKRYSKRKVPKFFMYAKDKHKSQVEEYTENNINRIANVIKPTRITFKDLLGKYEKNKLTSGQNVEVPEEYREAIVKLYTELNDSNIRKLAYIDIPSLDFDARKRAYLQLEYDAIRQREMFSEIIGLDETVIVDVLLKELQNDINKDLLWRVFGEIIYNNLQNNLKGTKICECCGERFEVNSNRAKYCESCAKEVKNEQIKEIMRKTRSKNPNL